MGVINALVSTGDFVFEDRLNHASLLDGGRISRATFTWFDHLDTVHLERELDAVAEATGRKLIGSDGTFSMDGDRCLLDDMIAVATRHRAWIMIDDAHGMGVHGHDGVGLVDPSAIRPATCRCWSARSAKRSARRERSWPATRSDRDTGPALAQLHLQIGNAVCAGGGHTREPRDRAR